MRNHPRSNGVQLDITHQCQQIAFTVDHGRPIASFPKRSASLVGKIEILHIAPSNGLKHLAVAVLAFRRGEQVDMVAHPDIGMHRQAVFL